MQWIFLLKTFSLNLVGTQQTHTTSKLNYHHHHQPSPKYEEEKNSSPNFDMRWLLQKILMKEKGAIKQLPADTAYISIISRTAKQQKGISYDWKDEINTPYISIISHAAKQQKGISYNWKDEINTPYISIISHAAKQQKGISYNWKDEINTPYISIISRAAKQRKKDRYKNNFNTLHQHQIFFHWGVIGHYIHHMLHQMWQI